MMMLMPRSGLAICRTTATVPTRAGRPPGRIVGVVLLQHEQDQRSAPSARLTVSIDTGRFTASGCSVSGKATVRRSGRTGSSDGRVGEVRLSHRANLSLS